MTTVWILELSVPYEPGHIEGVYSTKELAKAAVSVREWIPSGDKDGSEYEKTAPLRDMWRVTPYPFDAADGYICDVCGCWNRTGDRCKFYDDAHQAIDEEADV